MKISTNAFSAVAIALAVGALAGAGSASAAQAAALPSAASAVKDDQPMSFMVKGSDGKTMFVRENELDRPALTNISGGAKSITVNGKAYDVESTTVSRYGKTHIIDRSMVMMLDDAR